MKLWEKIFICTLIVFEAFFIPASIYLINSSFKLNIQEEINSGINEQDRFCSSLKSNLAFYKIKKHALDNNDSITKEEIKLMATAYLNSFRNDKIYLELFDEKDNTVFDNFGIKLIKDRPELIMSASDKVKYIIRDVNGKENLFIASKVNLENNSYKFSCIKDVSSIYINREHLLNTLLKLNLFVVIMLVIVLIILSKFILKPINKLIKSTEKIADGNFDERVQVVTDDEIGILSKHFNNMADVIEDKISELKRISEDKQRFIDDLTHELRTPYTHAWPIARCGSLVVAS
jgi:nitrogen fixation/metabolism regulation signal transduction histidine kinase